MSIPRAYTDAFKQQIVQKLGIGNSYQQVAQATGVSTTTLIRWKRLADSGSLSQGETIRQVALVTGISSFTIHRWHYLDELLRANTTESGGASQRLLIKLQNRLEDYDG